MKQNLLPLLRHRDAKNGRGRGIALAAFACLQSPFALAQSDADIAAVVQACQRVPELSARLACYDRAFPPVVAPGDAGTAGQPPPQARAQPEPQQAARPQSQPAAQPQPTAEAPVRARPARTLRGRDRDAPPTTVRIVEVETPDRDTTVFRSADGQVFVRQDARSTYTWPDTPFEVELQTSLFGTSTYLKFPGRGPRVRVAIAE